MQDLTQCERDILDQAQSILMRHMRKGGVALESPEAVKQYLMLELSLERNEWFCVLLLDVRHRVLSFKRLFQGTISTAAVYPRVVIQEALAVNAAAMIIVHNHPSGCVTPSSADKTLTRKIQDALSFVDVQLLDHFVVGSETFSFAENGLL